MALKIKKIAAKEEKSPKAYTFEYIRRKCILRKDFLEKAIKALQAEYPNIDFYQGFDWEHEACPYIAEYGDHKKAFWDFMATKGYSMKGEIQTLQEIDLREKERRERQVYVVLNQPCGAVKVLNLIYKRDPRKQFVSKQDKQWLKDMLSGREGLESVLDIMQNKCGDGERKMMARTFLDEWSAGISEQKNLIRFFKNKDKVSIRSKRGWITHYGFDGQGPVKPMRVRMASKELADAGFFDKYQRYSWYPEKEKDATVAFYEKKPLIRKKPGEEKKHVLDETIVIEPKALKIAATPKERLERLKKLVSTQTVTSKAPEKFPGILLEKPVTRKTPKPKPRLVETEGEFEATGGGQRDIFGGPTLGDKLEELRRRMRRRR